MVRVELCVRKAHACGCGPGAGIHGGKRDFNPAVSGQGCAAASDYDWAEGFDGAGAVPVEAGAYGVRLLRCGRPERA